jgi:hypothetical protein
MPDTSTDAVTEWMTYAELAEQRGISKRSAMRLALRHRWPRRRGNDGMARVGVPAGGAMPPERQTPTSDAPALAVLAAALEALKGELALAHAATDQARAEAERLRQADDARKARGRWARLRAAWRGE